MKYFYGNSYKEAISNTPIEINDTKILEAYKENYSNVFLAEDQKDCMAVVWKEPGDPVEYVEEYDFDEYTQAELEEWCEEQNKNEYCYLVLQHVTVDCFGEENIEILWSYGLD